MSVEVCDGCGRVAGEREVYCGACGRELPGRSPAVESSDAAPPGWLVAPTARDREGPWFEPLPTVAVPAAERPAVQPRGVPAYRVAEEAGRRAATTPAAPPPPPLPVAGAEAAGSGAALAVPVRVPALRALLVPLVVVALGSSAAAVVLLILHVLRDR